VRFAKSCSGSTTTTFSFEDDDDVDLMSKDDSYSFVSAKEETLNNLMELPDPTGNRILDISSLVDTIQSKCCCQHCCNNDLESFLLFCEEKRKQVNHEAAKRRNSLLKLKHIQQNKSVGS
jgi:hypothetical protein